MGATLELARRALERVQSGDVEDYLALVHPDVVYRQPPELPDGRSYSGHDGIREWLDDMSDAWEELRFDVDEWIEAGDRVAAIGTIRYRGQESGLPLDRDFAVVWVVRDGLLWRGQALYDPAEARAAVSDGAGYLYR